MKKTYNIKGMHCVSCEIVLADNLKDIEGIKNIKVSHKNGSAEIEFQCEVLDSKIEEIVKNSGYEISDNNGNHKSKNNGSLLKNILQNISIFLSVGFILFLLSSFEISKLYPDLSGQVNLLIALGLGVVASLSTCLALTGGIIIGFSAKAKIKEEHPPLLTRAKPQLFFHAGRLGGFFLLGGLLGLFGSAISFSLSFMTILIFAVGIVMFYLGLNIMGLAPNISTLGFHLPKNLALKIKKIEDRSYAKDKDNPKSKKHSLVPATLGVLTFFLPCGFTQSMQLAAVATGSFLGGAMLMLFFALGTMPVLFSVGLGSSFAQNKDFKLVKKFIGAFVIFFALYSINNALVLSGSSFSFGFSQLSAETQNAENKKGEDFQTIRMDIDYVFKQTEFKIVKDVPVKWEINAINVTGCTDEVIIPRLGLTTGKLKDGITVLEFTPTKVGVLPFSCWMGMQGGRFIVVDNENDLSKTNTNKIINSANAAKQTTELVTVHVAQLLVALQNLVELADVEINS